MQYSYPSQNLQALLPQGNYNVILSEKSRLNKYTHSQNTINIEQFDVANTTRRKSCHCSECGCQGQFQFKTMNIPLKQPRKLPKPQIFVPQLIVTSVESRKSTFYHKSSFRNLQILEKEPKESTNNMKLSLEIHGIRKSFNRQNTLLKLITDGKERSRRRESSGMFSSVELNSLKSLNITTSPTTLMRQYQPTSPLSLFSPKKKDQNEHNKFSTTITKGKIYYNPNTKISQKQLQAKPLRLLVCSSSTLNSLPKLSSKKLS